MSKDPASSPEVSGGGAGAGVAAGLAGCEQAAETSDRANTIGNLCMSTGSGFEWPIIPGWPPASARGRQRPLNR